VTRVLVVGSINMDLVMKAPRLPAPGETVLGGWFSVVPGGKGANQAASAARLGCCVRLVGAVGDDDFGAAALANLERQGVDVSAVARLASASTGVASILVDATGENSIVVAGGANDLVDTAMVAADLIEWADVVVLQCEIPILTVAAAIAAARGAGKLTILNAAPATDSLPPGAYHVDYLVVNEQEAQALTGIEPDAPESALSAARELFRRGATHAIVTLGAMGCVHSDSDSGQHIAAPAVEAADSTAAGDAFVGALATAVGEGRSTLDALRYANCAGALAVTKLGAQSSLPDADSVARMHRHYLDTCVPSTSIGGQQR